MDKYTIYVPAKGPKVLRLPLRDLWGPLHTNLKIRCGPLSFAIKGIKFYVEHAKNSNKLTYSLFKSLLGALGGP